MINAIVACDTNGGIGKNNAIPWPRIKEDMLYFKELTTNNVVVMGANTWYSKDLPNPLPNRYNVVITTRNVLTPMPDLCIRENIIKEVLQLEQQFPDKTIWIIGGATVFMQMSSIIDYWYVSRIDNTYDCDTFINKMWNDDNYELVDTNEGVEALYEIYKKYK